MQNLLVLLIFLLPACSQTSIGLGISTPALFRLASQGTKPVYLEVTGADSIPAKNLVAGHQYLLVFVPFGRIVVPAPLEDLYVMALSKLSERGYRTHRLPASAGPEMQPRLRLELLELDASGYDILFARRVSCALSLRASFLRKADASTLTITGEGHFSQFRRFAFKPELEHACNTALEIALQKVLDYLRL